MIAGWVPDRAGERNWHTPDQQGFLGRYGDFIRKDSKHVKSYDPIYLIQVFTLPSSLKLILQQ